MRLTEDLAVLVVQEIVRRNRSMEKTAYEMIKIHDGEIFICRGGFKEEGIEPKDLFSLKLIPQNGSVILGLTRLDTSLLFKESAGKVKISRTAIDLSFFLKEDSGIVKQIADTDRQSDAINSGILLAQDQKGIVR